MIENQKTFNDLRNLIKSREDIWYYEFDQLEQYEKDINKLIDTIEQQIKDCCNCLGDY